MTALRFGTHLAADASWAVTPRLDDDAVTLELWERDGGRYRPRPTSLAVEPVDQLLPMPGRRLFVCGGAGERQHAVWTVDCDTLTRTRLPSQSGRAVRLLAPAAEDPDRRPWALAYDGSRTTFTRLDVAGGPAGRVAADGPADRAAAGGPGDRPAEVDLSGAYRGGVWLDPAGRRLALGRSRAGEPYTTVEVDLATRTSRTLFEVAEHSNDTLHAWHPGTGLGVVHTDVGGVERLGYAHPARGERWAFPDELAAPNGLIEAVAIDPDADRILVHEQRGVLSLLHRYDVATRRRHTLPVPPGALVGQPVWLRGHLVVPWSTPEVPLTFLDLDPDAHPHPVSVRPTRTRQTDARVVTLPGAAGPIEAIAYGGDRWWQRPRLLLALHGGPSSAWRFAYHPFFARLAGEGVAVLAVNPRGSTGYGHRFAAAIRAGWGGPDLDDVLAVGRHLHARRGGVPGMGLMGTSYGGFLALLAAAAGPQLWRYCVAISAFSSAARLHQQAGPAVRRLIERSGGLTDPGALADPGALTDPFRGGIGARDVAQLGHRIQSPVLLVHGRHDEQIPVEHARELATALATALRYVELDAGHDIDRAATWDLISHFIGSADVAAPHTWPPATGQPGGRNPTATTGCSPASTTGRR